MHPLHCTCTLLSHPQPSPAPAFPTASSSPLSTFCPGLCLRRAHPLKSPYKYLACPLMQSSGVQPDTTRVVYATHPRNASGWGAVESAVREDDEQQVNDCKDDINTLLTFAGLYSAALTALLALAFAMLQEDVATESLQVLRRISTQTMTYQILPGGLLNATIVPPPPPPPTPFQPSDMAIRVNILWFASLVLSLATASIGILVKQWLRAYTTYNTSSSQSRMRIRRFRRRGLELWKVFEIAAALPYLIQLALGLFFVGLCYFTAEVDPRLGHTTIPVVAAWAFFFLMTSLFPVFSSQCPYKAVSFERRLSGFRRLLFSSLATAASMPPWVKQWAKVRTVSPDSDYSEPYNPIDEAHAAKYTGNDTEVMTWADGMQSDDELLGHGILAAMKQSQPNIKHVINFVLHAITDRTQADAISVDTAPKALDYTSLTPQAITGIVDILSQTSIDYIVKNLDISRRPDDEREGHIHWTLCILYSASKQAFPPSGLHLLGRCHVISRAVSERISCYVCKFIEVRAALKLSLMAVQCVCQEDKADLRNIVVHIQDTLFYYFKLAKLPSQDQAVAISPSDRKDDPEQWGEYLNQLSLVDTVVYLAEALGQHLQDTSSRSSAPQQRDILNSAYGLIFRLSATMLFDRSSNVPDNLRNALQNVSRDCVATHDAKIMISMLQAIIVQPPQFLNIFDLWIFDFCMMLDTNGLEFLHSVIQDIIQIGNNMPLENAINLSYTAAYSVPSDRSKLWDTNIFSMWRSIFNNLGQLLLGRQENTKMSEDSSKLLDLQIHWMDSQDTTIPAYSRNDEASYVTWSQTFDPEQSIFDDCFVSAMAKLYPKRDNYQWRIRRLEDLQKQERELEKREDAGRETAEVDAGNGDASEGAGQPVGAKHGVSAEQLDQIAVHFNGGGKGSLVEPEARTARIDEDNADSDTQAAGSQPDPDNRDLARGKQRQSVSSPHVDKGVPDGKSDPVMSSEFTASIAVDESGRRVVEDGGNGGPKRATSVGEGDKPSGVEESRTDLRSLPSCEQEPALSLLHADGSGGSHNPAVSAGDVQPNSDTRIGGGTLAMIPESSDDDGGHRLQDELTVPASLPEQSATILSPTDEGDGPVHSPIEAKPESSEGTVGRVGNDGDNSENHAAWKEPSADKLGLMSGEGPGGHIPSMARYELNDEDAIQSPVAPSQPERSTDGMLNSDEGGRDVAVSGAAVGILSIEADRPGVGQPVEDKDMTAAGLQEHSGRASSEEEGEVDGDPVAVSKVQRSGGSNGGTDETARGRVSQPRNAPEQPDAVPS